MPNQNKNSNRVRGRRVERGLTQSELAERAGISRTAVTAIEGNKLVPSVATALSVASALDCTVEELFGPPIQSTDTTSWAWEPTTNSSRYWHAAVFGRTLKYPASVSPMWTVLPDLSGDRPDAASIDSRETLVLACCDPAAGLLASQFQRTTGMRLIVIPRSSSESLELLKQGLVHLAGLHFSTADCPQRNSDVVRARLGNDFELIRLSQWQEGIAIPVASKHRTVRSVLGAKLTWIGREEGSGARQCLDQLLQGRRSPRCVARNHLGVATAIQSGWADAGVCVQLVSAEAGLRFLPVQEEAYDVCYPKTFVGDRRLAAFMNVVRSVAYRNLLSDLPGYNITNAGCVSAVN
jgi:putative molybdopterin biosynthesis protein